MTDKQPVHPADAEGQRATPTEQPKSHDPSQQVQPPNADAQDLYGPPPGQ